MRYPAITLKVENLRLRRGGAVLVDGVSLTACSGEVVIIRGPNGVGKTSLLRTLAGFSAPNGEQTGGVVYEVDGAPDADPAELCGYIGHADGLRPHETPLSHVRFFSRWSRPDARAPSPSDAELLAQLKDLGMETHARVPARKLSAGQRRRTALARLVLSQRPVWLLDEPAAALDTAGAERLDALVTAQRAAGGIVIAAIHGPVSWTQTRELRFAPQVEPQAEAVP